MGSVIPYAIYLALGLGGLSLIALVAFGARNLTYGKVNPLTAALVILPVLILIVLGFTTGDWAFSGIIACLVMLAVTVLSMLASGLRGLIGL